MSDLKPVADLSDDEIIAEWREFYQQVRADPESEASSRAVDLAREVVRRERRGVRIHPRQQDMGE